jgi:hypothetical protein
MINIRSPAARFAEKAPPDNALLPTMIFVAPAIALLFKKVYVLTMLPVPDAV